MGFRVQGLRFRVRVEGLGLRDPSPLLKGSSAIPETTWPIGGEQGLTRILMAWEFPWLRAQVPSESASNPKNPQDLGLLILNTVRNPPLTLLPYRRHL